jgi:cytochrome c556
MTPQAYRVGIMQQFQANQAAINAARMGQAGAPSHVLARATIIQQLAMMLSDAFPAGSAGEGSRALPAIWTNTADFQARVQQIQTAANGLVEAARSGNAEQVQTAATAVQGACGACHMAFRGPAPGN